MSAPLEIAWFFAALLAEDAPAQPGQTPFFYQLLFPLGLLAIFYFVVILPAKRGEERTRQSLLSSLKKGDKVLTNGGLYGTVVQVQDSVVTLQVDEGVRMKFALSAMQTVVDDSAPAVPAKT